MTRIRVFNGRRSFVLSAVLLCATLALSGAGHAQSKAAQSGGLTGVDSIHAQARYGSKVCMTEHEHVGESPPWVSRKGAQATAIRNWVSFTAWEYGRVWGSYANAIAKKMTCEQTGAMWVCKTTARPCRPGR